MKADSAFKIKISKKIEELPAGDWNKIFPPALENYFFFKTLDESGLKQFSFFYILIYENNAPVAATSCFTMNFPFDVTVSGWLKKVLRPFKKILSPRVLMCGLPMGQGRIGIKGDQEAIMDVICDSLETIARNERASVIIFKDFNSSYNNTLMPLSRKGFFKIESLPSTEMDVNFGSFEGFLKSLDSVSRSDLRRNFRKVDAKARLDLEITNVLSDEVLDQAYALYLQVLNNHEVSLEELTRDFFKNISKNMPGEARFFLWRLNGRLVAFAFCLVSGDYFIDYYLGFDYSVSREYYLYFTRFRDLMNWCIGQGIKKYEMGPTGYEAKKKLGFSFIRLYFYIKHRNPVMNFIFKALGPVLSPKNFEPIFKKLKNTE
ncbi:MAG: GNAT family N-acetyltransferase [Candidatus Omnitrophota bacterium]